MKYFDEKYLSLVNEDLPEFEAMHTVSKAYEDYIESLRSKFGDQFVEFAQAYYVDDGLLVRAVMDREQGLFLLTLRCGNLVIGYFDLLLEYHGFVLSNDSFKRLERIARMNIPYRWTFDIWLQEFELLEEGRIAHRIAFHDYDYNYQLLELTIQCAELKLFRKEMPDRKMPNRNRFIKHSNFTPTRLALMQMTDSRQRRGQH